jgi:hypothetical protein
MATVQAALTPTADTTPAVAKIPAKELSGEQWVARFPGSSSLDVLVDPFKANLTSFKAAIEAAGGTVRVNATYRPPERAYLMHWSYLISKGKNKPQGIPAMDGVNIEWDHGDDKKSIAAANDMIVGFQMEALATTPSLTSNHTIKKAADLTISWSGDLTIIDAAKKSITIKSEPKSGLNTELITVGATYNVIKYNRTGTDIPHWSHDGA